MVSFQKCYNIIFDKSGTDLGYWIKKSQIPIGAVLPVQSYKGQIPIEDVVTVPFDPVDTPFSQRKASNILLLGGSGDGKSLILKLMWYIEHHAGFYCIYVDPVKNTDACRARYKWTGPDRLPPYLETDGIPLEMFRPAWAIHKDPTMMHHFRAYSNRLSKIDSKEMWLGLQFTDIGASKVYKLIKQSNQEGRAITTHDIKNELLRLVEAEEIPKTTFEAAWRRLVDMEDDNITSHRYPVLDMYKEWKQEKSIVLSYNNSSRINMAFDIGHKIFETSEYYTTKKNDTPIIWYFDDASVFARSDKTLMDYNYALEQIKEIGFNYRGKGVYNKLAVQSLNVIDETVAETYGIKIISPKFQRIDQLNQIGIPSKAIEYLKSEELIIDNKTNTMQFLMVDLDKNVIPFFPFTPPPNHFTEVFHPRRDTSGEA